LGDRHVAVLFGDGAAAVVLEATEREEGWCAGETEPAPPGESKAELPPPERTALQLIQDLLVAKTTPSATPTPF
jgi:3-oxoacyl-[acyl-carrier-protein] synthase III